MINGDSMIPRFIDGQIVFVKEQPTLNIGDIGIFVLNDDAYCKKLGNGQLVSLNNRYPPIPIHDFDSFAVLGRVEG
jgi:phage repressor protein C with HTH and peptisase S24 domain